MKVKKITVLNLKALSALSVDLNGCTAIITWWNNKWKSSFLKSLPERMQWIKPNIVLKKGEEDWQATRELTDWSKFIWKFDWKKEKLIFIDKDWIETSKGVIKLLWEKYFWNKFDIDVFLTATPKKQREMLQTLVWLDLSAIDSQYKEAYHRRTWLNAILKNMEEKTKDLQLVPAEWEFVDTKKLEDELFSTVENNSKIKEVYQWIKTREEKLEELKKEIKSTEESIAKAKTWLVWKEVIDTDKLKLELSNQRDINDLINKNSWVQAEFTATATAKQNHIEADKKVKTIEADRIKLIKKAKLPEWFEFTDDWITYNGFELDKKQLSSSAVYIAALKLASMNVWDIQTLCFDASYLDNKSLVEIQTRADKQKLQLLIERPDFEWWDIEYEIIQ